ncbi:hypothetical protein H8A95_19925 [Bradyrhizobium sp. Pear76]|uniref:hypothetical protein n=1 Tax=Bradyrhizobium oropedii TaxID=1571201 RepID=UPI001E3B0F23|nr:hypothetical protein [Bradyrhizobium oropedii]MCC8964522.1 hypothetical protein [Bradyrhizobium oropedii]
MKVASNISFVDFVDRNPAERGRVGRNARRSGHAVARIVALVLIAILFETSAARSDTARERYDDSRAMAAAALASGRLADATRFATQAFSELSDGTKIEFTPSNNGVAAMVRYVNRNAMPPVRQQLTLAQFNSWLTKYDYWQSFTPGQKPVFLTDKEVGLPARKQTATTPANQSVPNWDDLPTFDPDASLREQDGPNWRFRPLAFMQEAERIFFAGVAFVLTVLVVLQLKSAFQSTDGFSHALLQRWSAFKIGIRQPKTLEQIKRQQVLGTIGGILFIAWWAVRDMLDPASSDRIQRLTNLEAHPWASFVGALAPIILLAPFGYWLIGRLARRTVAGAGQSTLETPFVSAIATTAAPGVHAVGQERWKIIQDIEPKHCIALGIFVAIAGFLLLDRWWPMGGFWGNVMTGKCLGVPYRYVLLCSIASVSWGLYCSWSEKKSAAVTRSG